MDLHQIEIFCTLIKLRSFSRTAEALSLTQPTVSGHMKNLETELGVRLLDRLGRGVLATQEGEVLFRYGQKLLTLRDQARQEIDNLSGGVSGLLKVGGSTIPGAYILPSHIGAFKKKHPACSIQLIIDDTAKVTRAVLDGELDIGVVGARSVDPHLESHAFLKDELVVAVPPGHSWARKRVIPAEELKKEPFILREQGSGTRRIMEEKLAKAGISTGDLDVVAVMGSSDAVRQAVKAGLGVSVISVRAMQEELRSAHLFAVRLKGLQIERSFYIILLKNKSRTPLCSTFLDFITSRKHS